jgi:hypothetical protein
MQTRENALNKKAELNKTISMEATILMCWWRVIAISLENSNESKHKHELKPCYFLHLISKNSRGLRNQQILESVCLMPELRALREL